MNSCFVFVLTHQHGITRRRVSSKIIDLTVQLLEITHALFWPVPATFDGSRKNRERGKLKTTRYILRVKHKQQIDMCFVSKSYSIKWYHIIEIVILSPLVVSKNRVCSDYFSHFLNLVQHIGDNCWAKNRRSPWSFLRKRRFISAPESSSSLENLPRSEHGCAVAGANDAINCAFKGCADQSNWNTLNDWLPFRVHPSQ